MIECIIVFEEYFYGVVLLYFFDVMCERLNIEKKIDIENNMFFKVDMKQIKEDIKVFGVVFDFYFIKDLLMVCIFVII